MVRLAVVQRTTYRVVQLRRLQRIDNHSFLAEKRWNSIIWPKTQVDRKSNGIQDGSIVRC
jgi:hypothetical protein